MNDLTLKQKAFVRHYLLCRNATEAARKAGYTGSDATLGAIGSENLKKPSISKYIEASEKRVEEKFEITRDMIVKELALVAFGNLANVFDEQGHLIDESKAAFLQSVSRSESSGSEGYSSSFSMSSQNKVKALELLGKHVGLWKDGNAGQGTDKDSQREVLERISKHLRKRSGGSTEGTDPA